MKKNLLLILIIVFSLCFSSAFAAINPDGLMSTVTDGIQDEVSEVLSLMGGDKPNIDLGVQAATEMLQEGENTYVAATGTTESMAEIPAQTGGENGTTALLGEASRQSVEGQNACVLVMDPGLLTDANGNFDQKSYNLIKGFVQNQMYSMQQEGVTVTADIINEKLSGYIQQLGLEGSITFVDVPMHYLDGMASIQIDAGNNMLCALLGTHDGDQPLDYTAVKNGIDYSQRQDLIAVISAIENGRDIVTLHDGTVISLSNYFKDYGPNDIDRLYEYLTFILAADSQRNLDIMWMMNPDGQDPTDSPDDDDDDDHNTGYDILASKSETPIPYNHMVASPTASIEASNDTGHACDCKIAIPTSENLTYHGSSDDVLYDIITRQHNLEAHTNGALNISATVTHVWYTYVWVTDYEQHWNIEKHEYEWVPSGGHEEPVYHSQSSSKSDTYSYSTSKTFYDVQKSDIYGLTGMLVKAVKEQYILAHPDGAHIPIKYSGPKPGPQPITPFANSKNTTKYASTTVYHEPDGCDDAVLNGLLAGIKAIIRGDCESAIGAGGNCNYTFKNLHVTKTTHNRTEPGWEMLSGVFGPDMIPYYYMNGTYRGSAVATYEGGFEFMAQCNNVIVHTPVVTNKVKIEVSPFINQKKNIQNNITYLQLDEGFSIIIPDDGTHNDYPGYGTRTYNSYQAVTKKNTNWGAVKDVKLPFDVYIYGKDGRTYYLPKNNWISEYSGTKDVIDYKSSSGGKVTYKFLVPVWAKEDVYDGNKNPAIKVRVIAENAERNNGIDKEEEKLDFFWVGKSGVFILWML